MNYVTADSLKPKNLKYNKAKKINIIINNC